MSIIGRMVATSLLLNKHMPFTRGILSSEELRHSIHYYIVCYYSLNTSRRDIFTSTRFMPLQVCVLALARLINIYEVERGFH